jgi:hypothetical protein
METVVETLNEYNGKFQDVLDRLEGEAHPHAANLPLMHVRPVLAIVASYFVLVWMLMRLTKWRGKGFELKPLVLLHNLSMFLLSTYSMLRLRMKRLRLTFLPVCVETLRQAWIAGYSLFGNGVDPSPNGIPVGPHMYIVLA